jgi:hypothetical protein
VKNVNSIDQFVRLLLGVVLLEAAFFWLAGLVQGLAYAAGVVLIATGALRFCPLYRILGIGRAAQKSGVVVQVMGALTLLATLVGGSYASAFFTRKAFLEEFNAMNHFYKQTLFLTGKNERAQAIANYDQWVPAYGKFQTKYTTYQPFALRGDQQLAADLQKVAGMITSADSMVRTGDLHQAHLDLEKVRPVFQEIFKRNGFSMLSVALVDFHDAMELMLDAANAKDAAKAIALYPQVSEKLQAVEAETQDAEIQAIRKNLDALLALAKDGQNDKLPPQAEQLKSSFVKVYLQRG